MEIERKFSEIKQQEQEYLSRNLIPTRNLGCYFFNANKEILQIRKSISNFNSRYKRDMIEKTKSIVEKIEKINFIGNYGIIDALKFIGEVSEYISLKKINLHIKYDFLQVKYDLELLNWKIIKITDTINVPDLIELIYRIFYYKFENHRPAIYEILNDIYTLGNKLIVFYNKGKDNACKRIKKLCDCITKMDRNANK